MMETLCVHPIHDLQGGGGSLLPDIRPSTAYRYLESEILQYPGFHTTYNQIRLGEVMAKLEHGSWGLALSSGMAAITTAILGLVKEGDHMICTRELYGGTRKFAEYELPRRGIEVSYVGSSPMELENAITDRTPGFPQAPQKRGRYVLPETLFPSGPQCPRPVKVATG